MKKVLPCIKTVKHRFKRWLYYARCRGISIANRMIGKKTIHFLHIGKTGGTAIKEVLAGISTTRRYRIILHPHNITLHDIPKGDGVVFFVRDPISRFVSGFYSRKKKGQSRYDAPWSPGEEAAFRQFSTPNELAKALSSKDKQLRESALRAMKTMRHVNSFYKDWFETREYLSSRSSDIFFVGYQEQLDKDFEILKQLLGLPSDRAKLPKDPIKAHRNPPNLDMRLGSEALENLREWYADDYRFMRLFRMIRKRILQNWLENKRKEEPW